MLVVFYQSFIEAASTKMSFPEEVSYTVVMILGNN